MLLKKQTVWLMTMFSLIAVLSIYYLTTPESKMATSLPKTDNNVDKESVVTEESASDPVFSELRLQVTEARSKEKERLQDVVATTEISEADKNKAYTEMQAITDQAATEGVLETLIKSEGYSDALVRVDNKGVNVTVKADEHSATEANNIIQMVIKELDEYKPVTVEFMKNNAKSKK